MPRNLQAEIHSDYTTGLAIWSGYRGEIKSLYDAATSKEDFNDHPIREYNKKIERLNQPTGLYVSPFDGGRRFTGNSIAAAKSVNLSFSCPTAGVTVTINGISKNISAGATFSFSEISQLVLSSNATISGTLTSTASDIDDMQASSGSELKISNITFNNGTKTSPFSFTIVYNEITSSDDIAITVLLNT
jgi:hypothetical protein